MNLLKNLNPAQKEAVEITDRSMLIIAGAGSGKTRVLTHKIAYLIKEKGVKPETILAMTFSNRAAKEMKDRIASLLSPDLVPYWVGTFHSICVKILREFINESNLKENFTIYDEDDQAVLIKESFALLNLDDKKFKPRALVELFSKYKNQNTPESRYFEREPDRNNLENIFTTYTNLLKRNNALDFGDILLEVLRLLKKQHVRSILSKRWKHILIDEYQDTNRVQRELLKKLKSKENFICVVGDDDQSIYMWRGATVENILSFNEDFSDSIVVKLEKNYRSTKKILQTANSLIQYNAQRMGKILFTDNKDGESVEYYQARDEKDEAHYISSKVNEITRSGAFKLSDIAVFYRTHAQSRAIEEVFVSKNIPYKVIGSTRFYDRKEIKDILAYLKFLANREDTVALKRIINVPPRGIGKRTIEMLESYAEQGNISPYEVIKKRLPFDKKTHIKLKPFTDLIEELDKFKEDSIHDLAQKIVKLSGYQKMLEEEDSFEAENKLDNIKELLSSIKEFEQIHPESTLNSYLETISLIQEADAYEGDDNYVTLMTVHCSKGLEFKIVFISGLEDGLFPHQNSLLEFSELEEERRLLYVAITRAMEKLYLSSAFQRRFFATRAYKMPSRFLAEIKQTYITPEKPMEIYPIGKAGRKERAESSYFYDYIPDYDDNSTPYRKGIKIRHPEFGEGIVQRCEKSGDHVRLTINFKYFGVKKIVPGYADLEIM